MLLKNTLLNKLTLSVIIIFISAVMATAQIPEITVIYPKTGQTVSAVDSTFIFGHLPKDFPHRPKDVLIRVNGIDFDVHPDGGFLAFVPVTPGAFTFVLDAYLKDELKEPLKHGFPEAVAIATVEVIIPEPLKSPPGDTLQILGDYNPPQGKPVFVFGGEARGLFPGNPGHGRLVFN